MTWDEFKKSAIEKGWQFSSDFLANLATHWLFTDKTDKEGKVVTGTDGKPVKVLNADAIRVHAPYLVQDLADEAEFNGLIKNLDEGLRKNLEIQMGPISFGPYRPNEVPPGLGQNQRSDVILTIVNMNERQGFSDINAARAETIARLSQLASISNPAEWKRQAVAFKLMRANESDYMVTRLTEQLQMLLASLVGEFRAAKREWDEWATATTNNVIRPYTRAMRAYLRTRPKGFIATLRRMFDLPWEMSAPGAGEPAHGGVDDYRPFGRRLQ